MKLEPCPFCGNPGAICCLEDEPGSPASFWVNCSCGIETRERRTEQEAIALWNTRVVSSPAVGKDVEGAARTIAPYSGAVHVRDGEVFSYYAGFNLTKFAALLSSAVTDADAMRAAAIDECAKVCERWIASKNLHESLAATDIARDIRVLASKAAK